MNSKESLEKPKASLADAPTASIRKIASFCSGSTNFSLQFLMDSGVPEEILKSWMGKESESNHSPVLFEHDDLIWITDLELLEQICCDYGISSQSTRIGREGQVDALQERIIRHLDESVPQAFSRIEIPDL